MLLNMFSTTPLRIALRACDVIGSRNQPLQIEYSGIELFVFGVIQNHKIKKSKEGRIYEALKKLF